MPVFFCTLQMASGWPAFHNKSRTWRTWLFSGSGYWRAGWRPNATVLSVMGDGSFNFSCGELETIVRYQLPIKTFVFSNNTFGWIKAGQNSGFDKRFYNVDFGQTDHAAVASAFGVKSWRANKPSELRSVIAEVLSYDGPALVDIIVNLHEAVRL